MFRYPGSKNRLVNTITNKLFYQSMGLEKPYTYVEPFIGSGSSTLNTLCRLSNSIDCVILNDLDYTIYAVWQAIKNHSDELVDGIRKFKPSLSCFYKIHEKFQAEDYYLDNFVQVAVEKMALHQMSAMGLGTMSGGPNGGAKQEGKEKVDSRWNPHALCESVRFANYVLGQFEVRILNKGFQYVNFPENSLLFLDPPTKNLYPHNMSVAEHKILANMLKDREHWLLYINRASLIRKWYGGKNNKQKNFVSA